MGFRLGDVRRSGIIRLLQEWDFETLDTTSSSAVRPTAGRASSTARVLGYRRLPPWRIRIADRDDAKLGVEDDGAVELGDGRGELTRVLDGVVGHAEDQHALLESRGGCR
jgi:hypothetical protein